MRVFTEKQIELAQRKARLLERIDMQRSQIAVHSEILKVPFGIADKALQTVRPWAAGVALFAAVVLGRRNLWRWAGRGWTLWRSWRFARRWLSQKGLIKI
jgi:hypothetical protein